MMLNDRTLMMTERLSELLATFDGVLCMVVNNVTGNTPLLTLVNTVHVVGVGYQQMVLTVTRHP